MVALPLLTVTGIDPMLPPLMALMVVRPAFTAATRPEASTVATAGLELCQAIARPLTRAPDASLTMADAVTACPSSRLLSGMVATTELTVPNVTLTVALPLLPAIVARTVTNPCALPVTRPFPLTEAIDGSELLHSIGRRPPIFLPEVERAVAVSVTPSPLAIDETAGEIVTDPISGMKTSTPAFAYEPPSFAMMSTSPSPNAEIVPSASTTATDVSEEVQFTALPIWPAISPIEATA